MDTTQERLVSAHTPKLTQLLSAKRNKKGFFGPGKPMERPSAEKNSESYEKSQTTVINFFDINTQGNQGTMA